MTNDPLLATLRYLVATKERIRKEYRFADELTGDVIRKMVARGLTTVTLCGGDRARLVPIKAKGSPSQRKRFRALYPAVAYDLKLDKLDMKGAA